jgi:eukaryotic-like serine/threonine-protein kinase
MNKYESQLELGRGGFGVVDKVVDNNGNEFARKTFSPASYIPDTAHEQLRKRFKREVAIQAQLGGHEIMPVVESNLNGDKPWFIMPLAEKSYEQQIADDRNAGSVDINAIAEILNALEYLHDMGYVHRDLNPKNILYVDGHWKLSDFGAVLPPSGHTVTLTGDTVIYTEQYCAPEQKNSFHSAQAPADVYSFGCILHDIFGKSVRVPYSKQSATGPIGLIIEKCTEPKPERRPSIKALRGMLLEILVEIGGHCKVADAKSEEWLNKLTSLEKWDDAEFDDFARFFAQLDIDERAEGHERGYVCSLSTPFLTRLREETLVKILQRKNGVAAAIIEKYCEWARDTAFDFHFSDTVGSCLAAIFDNGDAATKALALTALISLGRSHNRWYIMRLMLRRCAADALSAELARRFTIEIKTEELEYDFQRCFEEARWEAKMLHPELAKFCS